MVVHAGRQDVAILRRAWRTEVRNVFDTQVAGGFLGLGSQEGYESLVRKVLGTRLKGSEGFTRWDRRPLTAQQLEYAADDARCLLTLGERLEERLAEQGRLEWAREECRALEEVSDERPPERVYERLPRLARLSEHGRAVARELVEWREEIAEGMDRPAGFVLPGPGADGAGAGGRRPTATASSRSAACRRRRSTAAPTSCWPRSRAAPSARRRRAPPPRPRATRPTRRSCRWPRRWCASARWTAGWPWS